MADDYKYRIGSYTNVLGRPPQFYDSGLLRQAGCTFASVYAVRSDDAQAIQETAGTAAGFKGIVWSQRLWIDFDDNKDGTDKARQLLIKEGYDYVEYDTGGRGTHFGITRDALPSHILPSLDKQWVKENMEGADLSLYWHLHLIRLPGTTHERTGKRKVLVGKQSGRSLILPKLLAEPAQLEAESRQSSADRQSIFKVWQVASNLTGSGVTGDRHRQIVLLAVALKNDAHVFMDEAMWVCLEVNRGFDEPKPEDEIVRIVKWAYGKD